LIEQPEKDQHTAGKADGQTDYIDKGILLISPGLPEGDLEKVRYHQYVLSIRRDRFREGAVIIIISNPTYNQQEQYQEVKAMIINGIYDN
jgi:hypothetical protein